MLADTYGTDSKAILDTLSDLQLEESRRVDTLGRQGLHPWSIFYQRGDLAELEKENTWLRENYDSLVE